MENLTFDRRKTKDAWLVADQSCTEVGTGIEFLILILSANVETNRVLMRSQQSGD